VGAVKQIAAEQLDGFAGWLIVDVRSREEFKGEFGHLPDAVLTPLAELQEQAAAWHRDVPVLLVCRSGQRSLQGCSMLSEMGFTDVNNLSGGMMAWRSMSRLAR
jgi:rhodanese-related sulfurtransferase